MHTSPRARRSAALQLPFLALALVCAGPVLAQGDVLDVGQRRLVVAPLNLGISADDEVAPGIEPVTEQLLIHLRDAGHKVAALERQSAALLWREVLAEVRGADPRAGVHDVYASFAARVGEQVDYGVLVFPSLVVRAARVHGEIASWDGVDRWVPVPRLDDSVDTLRENQLRIYSYGGTGELAAASLHVAVFEPDGELRYEGAGGLSILQVVNRADERSETALVLARRENAFADPDELREGISAAFARDLPAAPAAQAD